MGKRAVFMDKDGTLVPDVPYNVNPELISITPGAGKVLARLKAEGYALVVISNQSGVARGLFTESALPPVIRRLNELLQVHDAWLDGFYYCPHLPDAEVARYAVQCQCRKPNPGMLKTAAAELGIDLRQSWMIGDILADTEAGNRAGCRTILIEKPYDPQRDFTEHNRPDFMVTNWQEAGQIILSSR